MSKTKMRCNTCGKWFQSANAKDLTCLDCLQKARKEKMAAKVAPPAGQSTAPRPAAPPPPKPKPAQSGTTHWLDTLSDVKVGQPDPPARPKSPPSPPTSRENRADKEGFRSPGGPGNYREGGERGARPETDSPRKNDYHSPAAYRATEGTSFSGTLGQRPRQPMEGGFNRGPRPDRPPRPAGQGGPKEGKFGGKPKSKAAPKPAPPPKPKREKIPPPAPFVPTPEQITQVETRYLELATPTEFDGIRTQIANELNIPKKAVKKIIKDLRDRQHIPSWWDMQTYKGDAEELAKIRAAYEPLLPLPDVGIHKQIAEQLSLKPVTVYQAIKEIRAEMGLPQYNDPALHGLELSPSKKGKETQPETTAQTEEQDSSTAKDTEQPAETTPQTEEQLSSPVSEEAAPETRNINGDEAAVAIDTDSTEGSMPTEDVVPAVSEENAQTEA